MARRSARGGSRPRVYPNASRRGIFLAQPVTVDRDASTLSLSSPTRRRRRRSSPRYDTIHGTNPRIVRHPFISLSLSLEALRSFAPPPPKADNCLASRGRGRGSPFVIAELYLERWLIRTIGMAVRGSGSVETEAEAGWGRERISTIY